MAPEKEGKYMNNYRFGYLEGQEIVYFGQKISFEIEVKANQQKKVQESGISCNKTDMNLFKCNKEVLEKAQSLKEIF